MNAGRERAGLPSDQYKDEIAARVCDLLISKAEMLDEYFRIGIDSSGLLVSMPELLTNHTPAGDALPLFLLRLATETDWEDELRCFASVARELSLLYSYLPERLDHDVGDSSGACGLAPDGMDLFKMCVYPALRSQLIAPKRCATDGTVLEVAALEQLYKVFERC